MRAQAQEVQWAWEGRGHRALGKFVREVQSPSSPLAADQPLPRISLPLELKCFSSSHFIFETLQTKPSACFILLLLCKDFPSTARVSHGSLVFLFPEERFCAVTESLSVLNWRAISLAPTYVFLNWDWTPSLFEQNPQTNLAPNRSLPTPNLCSLLHSL